MTRKCVAEVSASSVVQCSRLCQVYCAPWSKGLKHESLAINASPWFLRLWSRALECDCWFYCSFGTAFDCCSWLNCYELCFRLRVLGDLALSSRLKAGSLGSGAIVVCLSQSSHVHIWCHSGAIQLSYHLRVTLILLYLGNSARHCYRRSTLHQLSDYCVSRCQVSGYQMFGAHFSSAYQRRQDFESLQIFLADCSTLPRSRGRWDSAVRSAHSGFSLFEEEISVF